MDKRIDTLQSVESIDSTLSSGYYSINNVAKRLLREKYSSLPEILIPILLDTDDCRSYAQLAQDLLAEECSINAVVAKKIIHLAAQCAADIHNLSVDENTTIIDLNKRTSRVKRFTNFARNSGVTMVEALGRVPFSFDEIKFIVQLMESEEFQWNLGSNKGKPNWGLIALALNNTFGTNRTAQSISDQIKTLRYQNDQRLVQAYKCLELSNGSLEG